MNPYFYVHLTRSLVAPTVRHATLPSAQAEAERLAAKHPGAAFEILKCVAISQVKSPAVTFFVDGEDPNYKQPGGF